jgi:xylan 1,4-beta-xylosidase
MRTQTNRLAAVRPTLLFLAALAVAFAPACAQTDAAQGQKSETIVVDAAAPAHAFPHFWEEMFGSGRAILSLRDSYRRDLREVRQVTDFRYVRFHGILNDDVGVYGEDAQGKPLYNFSYVDQIYDGLLANGVRPFVEISFMPKKLAASEIYQAFWYHPNVSPPKSWTAWDDLMTAFAQHLIDRYGIDEVSQWYFEVWNEPNLDFWGGHPRQSTYWELYDHTARALKAVSPRLRVGGPATAQAAWVDAFIKHCHDNNVPVDFVSTHVYGNDKSEDVFGTHETIGRDEMVCRAVSKVHKQIEASTMPNIPLIWSEFNAAYDNEPDVTDAAYMGPWMADTIRQCDGMTQMMSYWTFSDVFEEQGVVKKPFYGGFGLIAEDGIPKASFNAFRLLHQLGNQRVELTSDSALVTRREDGTLVVAVWNYAPPGKGGATKNVTLEFKNFDPKQASVSFVDSTSGDSRTAWEKMGAPAYPTQEQIRQLTAAGDLHPPSIQQISNHQLTLTIPAYGLDVVELK